MKNIYVVDNEKQIRQTKKSPIYKGDFNVESLTVLISSNLINDIKSANAVLCFTDNKIPNKNLVSNSNLYKGYYVFQAKVDALLTNLSGNFTFYISCFGVNFKFETGTAKFEVLERGQFQ